MAGGLDLVFRAFGLGFNFQGLGGLGGLCFRGLGFDSSLFLVGLEGCLGLGRV